MADQEKKKKIPVFTVVKNGSILKNIFLLDNPPTFPTLNSTPTVGGDVHRKIQAEEEEVLVVGRHPDCNITLEHPSISRYHLRINSKPSSQSISVLDLSSVHGTWVSGKRIEPGILVKLQEGDTVRLGGSSRVYELHWVPVNRAYDLEHPFLPPLDKSNDVEEETHQDENSSYDETNERQLTDADLEGLEFILMPPLDKSNDRVDEEEAHQDENSSYAETNERQLPDADSKCLELLPCNYNHELSMTNLSLLAPLVSEGLNPTNCDDGEIENRNQMSEDQEEDQISSCEQLESDFVLLETENQLLIHGEETGSGITSGIEKAETPCKTNEQLKSPNIWSRRGEMASIQIQTGRSKLQILPVDVGADIESWNQDIGNEIVSKSLIACPDGDEEEIFAADKENCFQKSYIMQSLSKADSPKVLMHSSSYRLSPLRNNVTTCDNDENEIITGQENLKNVKHESASKILFSSAGGNEEDVFTPDKENFSPKTLLWRNINKMDKAAKIEHPESGILCSLENIFGSDICQEENSYRLSPLRNTVTPCDNDENEIVTSQENLKNVKHESASKILFSSAGGNEEDVFTPDKENVSPKTLLRRNMNKMDKAAKIEHPESEILCSLENIFGSDISQEENSFLSSDRVTQTPKVLQGRKSGKPVSKGKENLGSKMTKKRLPLQSLPVISGSKTKSNYSVLGASSRSSNSVNYAQNVDHQNTGGVVKKMWTMVIDTKCLLHRGSRKALQLLQGVKGTQLIIPRIVIRELDQIKLRGSLFRRTTEASLALQWIEDCLVNAKSWIHVQSSAEEGMPIAPTPRALSLARLTDEWGVSLFSSAQIATPTTEDNVLECALFFRRIMIDRQFVLLSEDISLKIKSMGEGVICETAEEFRQSLINPFSERFLWDESSPRGATWSCKDDILLRERYNNFPLKKPQSLKGLKLILLHNSQFRQISSIS